MGHILKLIGLPHTTAYSYLHVFKFRISGPGCILDLICVYGLSWYIRNVYFMYISFMPFLRYLLPKCLSCICVRVCFHTYVKITFCTCTGYTSVAFADHCMHNLWVRPLWCVPYYNSCAKHKSCAVSVGNIAVKNTMPTSTSYLLGKKPNHNNTKHQKRQLIIIYLQYHLKK